MDRTVKPLERKSLPNDAPTIPLPNELTTPPVINIYFVIFITFGRSTFPITTNLYFVPSAPSEQATNCFKMVEY